MTMVTETTTERLPATSFDKPLSALTVKIRGIPRAAGEVKPSFNLLCILQNI